MKQTSLRQGRRSGAGEPYASALIERVPEDAFVFITFQGKPATQQLEQLGSNPLYSMGLQQFERELGIRLEDLLALFDGEVVFHARPAAPFPELTLLLESANVDQPRASADNMLRAIARQGAEGDRVRRRDRANFANFTVNLTSVEKAVVLTTSRRGLADLEGSGGKLADTDRYKAALDTGGRLSSRVRGRTFAILSGPNIAHEIAHGHPAAAVIASNDDVLAFYLEHAINSPGVRVYVNNDPAGVELAAAAKNVIALAAGAMDGLGLGGNAKAALITLGRAELRRLGVATGARGETFAGLAGTATCSSPAGAATAATAALAR